MSGFDTFTADRNNGKVKGGGVLLYIKSRLKAAPYESKWVGVEHVCCEIRKDQGTETVICVCYRSDNVTLFMGNSEATCELIAGLSNINLFLMGDFNYPDIDWSSRVGIPASVGGTMSFE